MRKLKRRKIIKEYLEEEIAKNQRRIQNFADRNFKLRLQLELLNSQLVQKPLTKADIAARDKAVEEAVKAAAEPVMDNADQEIGTMPVEEKI